MYSLTKSTSSKTIEDGESLLIYDCGMQLNQRIHKARSDAKLTQDQLASATGKSRGAVSQWESGEVHPRPATLSAIAKATGVDLRWLTSGVEPNIVGLMVIGEVAAGLWREGSVEFKPFGVPVAAHPGYPASSQRLYKVSGTSVNRIVEDGEYVHCVSVIDGGISPESGDIVIVCRSEHGLSEYTAKRYIVENGTQILRPESKDDQWQQDIVIDGNDDTSIVITDVVIAKWSPIRRGF